MKDTVHKGKLWTDKQLTPQAKGGGKKGLGGKRTDNNTGADGRKMEEWRRYTRRLLVKSLRPRRTERLGKLQEQIRLAREEDRRQDQKGYLKKAIESVIGLKKMGEGG